MNQYLKKESRGKRWGGIAIFFVSLVLCQGQTPPPVLNPLSKAELTAFALQQAGDPVAGKKLFTDENRAMCLRCHTTDGQGGKAGPDLSAIGDKFSRSDLIRSVLEPSATVAVGYGTTIITTKDDEEVQGVIKQATATGLELVGGDGRVVRVALAEIKDQRTTDVSLMPEGMETAWTPQEFANLIAYLETLHQSLGNLPAERGMPENIAPAAKSVGIIPFFDAQVHLSRPLWFGPVPGTTNRFVVLEHAGRSWVIENRPGGDQQKVLLDLRKEVRFGGATGLLGIAFHPHFRENRKYYLKYQVLRDRQIFTHLVERQFTPDFSGDAGGPSRLLLEIGSVTQDHHGGSIVFGPDGYLYLGMGDTGPQQDPQGHGQDLTVLWSKMLRLDVDRAEGTNAYGIPQDNPFLARANVRPEIWAYGFREPWRFSFDSLNGDLWVGDVGQDRVEEVSLVRVGENLGWNVFEGHTRFSDQYRRPGETYVAPVFSYSHRLGVSVTGGFVYRGKRAPQFYGHYVCADFETRRIWALTQTNRLLTSIVEIGRAPSRVASFGQDGAGELYLVGYDSGAVYQLDLAAADPRPRQSRVIAGTAEESPVLWRYALTTPAAGWARANFDDSVWPLAPGGFGTRGTPGAIVRTEWNNQDIWIRRVFSYAETPSPPPRALILRLHHDEDAEVFLNGVEIAREPRWTSGYVDLPLTGAATKALRPGRNVLAVHCRQNTGGQYIDAGLLEFLEPLK